jgi:hypothetical protein
MSLFSKLKEKLTGGASGSSASLEKIRAESERRRSAKSSGTLPRVDGEVIVEQTISSLEQRISSNTYQGVVKNAPKPKK